MHADRDLPKEGEGLAGSRVVVTGGLGFIGSHLARRLVESGADVTILDSAVPEGGANLFNISAISSRVRVVTGSIGDGGLLAELLPGCAYVFNLAGRTSHADSVTDPRADSDSNCRGQLELLEACRTCCPEAKVVFTSTRQVYGRPDYLPVDERHCVRPLDINGIHKLAAEGYHLLYGSVHGLRTCVLRVTNTVGPHMRIRDSRQMFLGTWVRAALEGRPVEVWGGAQVRDIVSVQDVVEAIIMAAASRAADGAVFNVGNEAGIALVDLARMLVRLAGAGEVVQRAYPASRQPLEIGDFRSDCARIRSVLGWQPRVPLEQELSETLAFYREHLAEYV
jgi:UDP-glucose 4-epimerase